MSHKWDCSVILEILTLSYWIEHEEQFVQQLNRVHGEEEPHTHYFKLPDLLFDGVRVFLQDSHLSHLLPLFLIL